MDKEMKMSITGFMCLLIGILISLFIDVLFWVGLVLVIIAGGLLLYSHHIGSAKVRNEIKKINAGSNIRLMIDILNMGDGGNNVKSKKS